MAKLVLTDIVAGYQATTAVNANNAATEAAVENTLSLDGTTPNAMLANLDMNGYSILNSANALGAVTSVTVNAPITDTGTATVPILGISAATGSVAGSMSAAHYTKLDNIADLTGHITSSNNVASLGSFTSAELATALTNETGSGTAVFSTSPTLVTPALGTPSALVGTNITGTGASFTAGNATLAANVTTNANLTGHITSTGNAAILGSFTSAQLGTALTDETGSGLAVFDTSPTIASPTMTGTVTVPTPSNNTDAATKAYVDTIKQGSIDIKDSCRVASTADIAIASALTDSSTIDGITVATGDRVLLKDQSDASENGIYAVVASGAASRTTDADTDVLMTSGMYTFISEGTVSNAMGYVLTTADPITLDTTNLTYTQFSGAGQIAAGTGMTKTGNTLDVIGTSGRIVANANTMDIGTDVALVADPLSQFGATTSLQLKGVLSDETGSGSAVFATSPTLVTPALGTPASGVVTNLTGTASININGTVGATTPTTGEFTTMDATGAGTAATFEPDGDTSAGDNAAIGYTAAEGLILTGEGSVNDVTIKNDADTEVMGVATGTTVVDFASNPTVSDVEVKVGGKETIWIPSGAMYPSTTNGCAAIAQAETTALRPDLKVLDFDPSSDEFAQFSVAFPKSWNEGTVSFQPLWTVTGTDTGTVAWQLGGVAISSDGSINTVFGTLVATNALAHSGTSNDLMISVESGAVTIDGSPAADDQVFFQINRDVSADSQTGDARLLGVRLFFTTDAANDA